MNLIRPVLLVAVALAGALVPQVPSQASELVKLGRLIVTGKRAPVAPQAEEPKASAVVRPVVAADAAERNANAPRATEAAAEARDLREVRDAAPAPADRGAADTSPAKPGLERGGSVSSSGAGAERSSESLFSFKSWLRAI